MKEKRAYDEVRDAIPAFDEYISAFHGASSRVEALGVAVEILQLLDRNEIDEPGFPAGIVRNFMELAYQIRFELDELGAYGNDTVEDYIIDNLYTRAEAYLDIFQGQEAYCRKITMRMLTVEDPVIIREHRLSSLVSHCISEFYEQPSFRFELLTCLLMFENEELVNFFYEVVKNEMEPDLRIAALLGLYCCGKRFSNWKNLYGMGDDQLDELVHYAVGIKNGFEPATSTGLQNNYILLFNLLYIEHVVNPEEHYVNRGMIFGMLVMATGLKNETGQLHLRMMHSVRCILEKMPSAALKKIVQHDDDILMLINILDNLPVEIFDKVLRSLRIPGEELARGVEKLVDRHNFNTGEFHSNMLAYLHDWGLDAVI